MKSAAAHAVKSIPALGVWIDGAEKREPDKKFNGPLRGAGLESILQLGEAARILSRGGFFERLSRSN